MDDVDLYDAVCALLLLGHAKDDEDASRVFTRCTHKAMQLTTGPWSPLPIMSRGNVRVELEDRKTDDLRRLSNRPERDIARIKHPIGHPKRFKKKLRLTKDIPIIVVNYRDADYLVDGNRRVNYSIETGRAVMKAYVCYVSR